MLCSCAVAIISYVYCSDSLIAPLVLFLYLYSSYLCSVLVFVLVYPISFCTSLIAVPIKLFLYVYILLFMYCSSGWFNYCTLYCRKYVNSVSTVNDWDVDWLFNHRMYDLYHVLVCAFPRDPQISSNFWIAIEALITFPFPLYCMWWCGLVMLWCSDCLFVDWLIVSIEWIVLNIVLCARFHRRSCIIYWTYTTNVLSVF